MSDEGRRQTSQLDGRVTVSHPILPDVSVCFGHISCVFTFLGKTHIFLFLITATIPIKKEIA